MLLAGSHSAVARESLAAVLRYAVAKSQLVGAEQQGLIAANAAKDAATAGFRPTVQGYAEYGALNSRYQSDPSPAFNERSTNPRGYGLQVNYNLWNGFKTTSLVEREGANIDAAASRLENTQQAVLLDAATAYVTVIRDRVSLRLYRSNLDVMRLRAREVKARMGSGLALPTDLDQAQAYVSKAEADEAAARALLDTSLARYTLAVGKPAGELAPPSVPHHRLPRSLDEALARASGINPAIRADEASHRAARANIDVAKASYAPSVDVTASLDQKYDPINLPGANELKTAGATVRLTVPIYSGGLTPAQVDQAEALSRQQDLRVQYQRRNVEASVTAAWNQYRSTGKVVAALKAQVRASDRSLDGLQKAEKAGTKIGLEVYEGRRLLMESRVALANAERDQIVAAYNLLASVGMLTPDVLTGGGLPPESELVGGSVLLSNIERVLEPVQMVKTMTSFVSTATILPTDAFRRP